MWHAADGDLHAYLDGALDFYPSEDAQRIRGHLESCAECKRRLEEERALAARAREVLAGSGPAQAVAPPFEELRRRADVVTRTAERPRRFHGERWAWAATVVMALGIGWRIGVQPRAERGFEVERDGPQSAGPPVTAPATDALQGTASAEGVALPSAAEIAAGAGAVSIEAEQRTVVGQAAGAGAAGTLADASAAGAAGASPNASTLAREEAARGVAPPAGVANFQFRAADLAGDAARGGAAGRPAAGPPVAEPPATSPPLPTPGSPAPGSPFAGRALGLDEIVVTGTAGASRREVGNTVAQLPTAPLGLPGVPINTVDWMEVAPGVSGIRVTQGVEGAPVELYFVGVGLDAAARSERQQAAVPSPSRALAGATSAPAPAPPPPTVSGGVAGARSARPIEPEARRDSAIQPSPAIMSLPLPTGWRQLAQPFRGGWVIIRAPLPDDRLRVLLERAGAGTPPF